MIIDEKIFELGETRLVVLDVWLNDGSEFRPVDPAWSLTKGSYESHGLCEAVELENHHWKLTALVTPTVKGDWKLTYTFGLGAEIVKKSVMIKVV